jgi:hypothetical protein
MSHGKKLGMMLEVLGSGLNRLHNVGCGEQLAVMSRSADQKAAHQRKLRGQHGEFPLHRGLRACLHSFLPKGKLAANDGVDEEILHYVGIVVEERRIEAIVGDCVLRGETLERCAGPIADALGEAFNALDKPRTHIGLVQHHSRQPQHYIQLGSRVHGQICHSRAQRPCSHR